MKRGWGHFVRECAGCSLVLVVASVAGWLLGENAPVLGHALGVSSPIATYVVYTARMNGRQRK